MLITKSEYVVALASGVQKRIVAESIKDVCSELETDDQIVGIFRDRTVEQYEVPDNIMVSAVVDTLVAQECGCSVFPYNPISMSIGDTLVLSATEGSGWKFKEWKLGDETVSVEKQALVKVSSPDGAGVVTYSAVFIPDSD